MRGTGWGRESRRCFPAGLQSARRSGPFCIGKRGGHQKRETGYACLPLLVPVVGLEPTRYRYQRILSPSRLPIPSHRRSVILDYTGWERKIQEKLFASGIMPWHPIKNEQSVKNVEKRKKDYPRPGKRAIMYPLKYAYRQQGARG